MKDSTSKSQASDNSQEISAQLEHARSQRKCFRTMAHHALAQALTNFIRPDEDDMNPKGT